MSRRFKLILLGSLLLNMLLLGMVTGLAFKHLVPRQHRPTAAERALAALPDERAALLKDEMKTIRQGFAEDEAGKAARHRLRDVMRAESFDRDAYLDALRTMFAQRDRQRDAMGARVTEFAATLNQKERVALSKLLDAARPKYGKR